MIAREALAGLLDRLQAAGFSGRIEIKLTRGDVWAVELHQSAQFNLAGCTVLQTGAPGEPEGEAQESGAPGISG